MNGNSRLIPETGLEAVLSSTKHARPSKHAVRLCQFGFSREVILSFPPTYTSPDINDVLNIARQHGYHVNGIYQVAYAASDASINLTSRDPSKKRVPDAVIVTNLTTYDYIQHGRPQLSNYQLIELDCQDVKDYNNSMETPDYEDDPSTHYKYHNELVSRVRDGRNFGINFKRIQCRFKSFDLQTVIGYAGKLGYTAPTIDQVGNCWTLGSIVYNKHISSKGETKFTMKFAMIVPEETPDGYIKHLLLEFTQFN